MQTAFHAPSTVLVGGGSRKHLPAELQKLNATRVLVVTDEFLVRSGVVAQLLDELTNAHIEAAVFSGVQPDPTVQNVLEGTEAFRHFGAQAIVAIGGGSPIDAAKIIGVLSTNNGSIAELQGYHKVPVAGPPLIAIPTTAGTGSEATKVAVITDADRRVKMMILDAKLMPRVAIVDYELTLTMPKALTAHVGVDTLTHGIEAYVSAKSNGMTDPLALSCIRLTASNLYDAWLTPDRIDARSAMSLAACHGGMAFTNSSVCLVHGMSRPIGALFHVPHGLSNAVLLPAVTRFSVNGAPQRYAQVARTMGLSDTRASDADACSNLVRGLERLNEDLQIPRLGECLEGKEGEFTSVLEKMASDALASGSPQNNPVVPSVQEIISLYREVW